MAERIKKIAGKTDSAVKTAESWWSFGREAYQMLGATVAFSGVIIAGAVQLWQSALSVGWEYYALIGPPIFILTLLVIGFVQMKLALWKRSKSQPEKIETTKDSQIAPLSMSSLEEILVRISALEKVNSGEKVAEIVAPLLQGIDETMQNRFEEFKTESHRALDALHQRRKMSDAIKFAELAEILDAKSALEIFDDISSDIDESIEILDKIPLDADWSGRHKRFKSNLNKWDTFKTDYPTISYAPLFDVDPEKLKSFEWSDEVNALSVDEGLEYKHYRLAMRAYLNNRDRVRAIIAKTANKSFHGKGASGKYVSRFDN